MDSPFSWRFGADYAKRAELWHWGKKRIDLYNTSILRGNSPSYGTNYQKVATDLASVDELAVLDGGKWPETAGVRPFKLDKYDLDPASELIVYCRC